MEDYTEKWYKVDQRRRISKTLLATIGIFSQHVLNDAWEAVTGLLVNTKTGGIRFGFILYLQ
jgi:hypothetical protein